MFLLSVLSILILSFVDESTAAAAAAGADPNEEAAIATGDGMVYRFKLGPIFTVTLNGEEWTQGVDPLGNLQVEFSRLLGNKAMVTRLNHPSEDVTILVEGGRILFAGNVDVKTLTVEGPMVIFRDDMKFTGGDVKITSPGLVILPPINVAGSLVVKAGEVDIIGDIEVTGDVTVEAAIVTFNSHSDRDTGTNTIKAGKSVIVQTKGRICQKKFDLDITARVIRVETPVWFSWKPAVTCTLHGISDVSLPGKAFHSDDILRLRVSESRVLTRIPVDGHLEGDRLDAATTGSISPHS